MGKIIKAVITAIVVTVLVIVTAGAVVFALQGAGVLAGTTFMGAASLGALWGSASFITAVALAGAGALITSLMAPKMSGGGDGVAGNFGSKVSSRGIGIARQIIYGMTRASGVFAHMETTGTDGSILSLIVVVSGHPIEGYTKVYYNDIEVTTTSTTEQGETVYYATNTDLRDMTGENPNAFSASGTTNYLVRFTFHDGTQTAKDGFAQAMLTNVSIPDTHVFKDCAYFFFQCAIDAEKNSSMPKISFELKGKNVYDPRTGAAATTDAQRSNPALCLYDYLSDTTYGIKAKEDEVNISTNAGGIAAAANICDQQVLKIDGETYQSRYTLNGLTNMQASGESIIEGMLGAMSGKMTFTNGKFQTFAGAAQTPEFTITDGDALGPFEIVTKKRTGDMYNGVKALFPDKYQKYVPTETPFFESGSMLLEDTPVGDRVGGAGSPNYKKLLEVALGFTTDSDTAQRIAKIQLLDQRQTTRVQVRVPIKYIQCQPNDWLYITNSRMGWTQKLFQIEDMSLQLDVSDDGAGALASVALSMRETDAAVYDFAQSDYTAPEAEGGDLDGGTFSLSAPTIGSPSISTTVDGAAIKATVTVNWTNASSDEIIGTEVHMSLGSGSFSSMGIAAKTDSAFEVTGLNNLVTYIFKVRHVGTNGQLSAFSSTATATPNHISGLVAPTSVSVVNNRPLALTIKWTNPTNSNLRSIIIYESSSSIGSSPSSTLIVATLAGEPGQKMELVRGDSHGLTAGTTYYYKLKAVLHTGQESVLSSQVSGAFTGVNSSVVDFPVAGFFQLDVAGNTNAPTDSTFETAFDRLPMDEDFIMVQNTSASPKVSKAYKYGSADSGGGGGSFTEVSDVFTGDLLVAGTLGADKIVANSLSSDSGVFGVISANDIATGSLKADYISIDGVTIDTVGSTGSKSLIIKGAGVNPAQLGLNAATWAVASVVSADASVETPFHATTDQFICSPPLTFTTSSDASLRPTFVYVEGHLNYLANATTAETGLKFGIHESTSSTLAIGDQIGTANVKGAQGVSIALGFSTSISTAHVFSQPSQENIYYYLTWSKQVSTASYRRGSGSINVIGRQR